MTRREAAESIAREGDRNEFYEFMFELGTRKASKVPMRKAAHQTRCRKRGSTFMEEGSRFVWAASRRRASWNRRGGRSRRAGRRLASRQDLACLACLARLALPGRGRFCMGPDFRSLRNSVAGHGAPASVPCWFEALERTAALRCRWRRLGPARAQKQAISGDSSGSRCAAHRPDRAQRPQFGNYKALRSSVHARPAVHSQRKKYPQRYSLVFCCCGTKSEHFFFSSRSSFSLVLVERSQPLCESCPSSLSQCRIWHLFFTSNNHPDQTSNKEVGG